MNCASRDDSESERDILATASLGGGSHQHQKADDESELARNRRVSRVMCLHEKCRSESESEQSRCPRTPPVCSTGNAP